MAGSRNVSFDPSKLTKATAADYSSSDSDADEDDVDYRVPSTNPHDDEFADFNPRKRRRTGRDAKESAALGIFGSDSEDDATSRFKHKTLRRKGVSFVASAEGKKKEDEDEDGEEESDGGGGKMMARASEEDEEEDEDEEQGGVGLGFGGGAAAAAPKPWVLPQFTPASTTTPKKTFIKSGFAANSFNADTPLGRGFTPSSASAPVLKEHDDDTPAPRAAQPSAFAGGGLKGKKAGGMTFAQKMMAKMGYQQGQGLGKEGQGRNVVIEANLRPQRIGLGAVKEKTEQERAEEKRQAALRGEVLVDSDEEEKKKKAAARRKKALGGASSTASGASTPKRQKARYLTMDEVKKAAPGLNIPDAFTPILDMTGPGKRMLTSSSGLMTPTGETPGAESAEAAESRKLVRRAQNDLMAIMEEWQSLRERKAYVDLQLQQEQQDLDEYAESLKVNQDIVASCTRLSLQDDVGEVDRQTGLSRRLSQILAELTTATAHLSDAILPQVKDELLTVAVAALHPTFKEYLQLWDPLDEPKPRFLDDLVSVSDLLGFVAPRKSQRKKTATPYEAMMYKIWLPKVASAVREWNVRDSDQLLAVFEAWQKLMPGFVRAQLLGQDIVRKLEEAVAKWEPKRKKNQHSLPHVWIFPWLQYLPPHHLDPRSSTGLVADVKRKFRQLIDVWEFDRGVIPGLAKWKEVLRPSRSQDQWKPLVMNHILPSMARYLRSKFKVDPQDQEPYLEMLTGVFEWLDVISATMVGEVVVAEVFPLWHDVLYQWLIADEANYEEIGQWFEWWRDEVFPDAIKSLPSVAAEFEKGTALIERALDLGDRAKTELQLPQAGPALQVPKSPREKGHHRRHRHPEAEQPTPKKKEEEAPAVTFKSIVEDWCQANDLQFIPERKKVHAEGPLYRITARGDGKGGVLVYFKGDRLFAETRKNGLVEIRADSEADLVLLLEYAQ
ncbi:TFP11-domain-containing protein [Coniochaeta hoffmannii]|uniref:TFP11-domain-containing protein n=1 Tax=Coniochaeta hoffmannii TaxID=91930 RepID=A0AA38VIU1_9PEZI|nr:TFP11-domain-containing protein [Coniochaeta hoffmannii]